MKTTRNLGVGVGMICALAIAIAVSSAAPAQAADERPLDRLATDAVNIEAFQPNSTVVTQSSGSVDPLSLFHPLNSTNLAAAMNDSAMQGRISQYSEAYQTFKVVNIAEEMQVIAAFVYRYPDAGSANTVARELTSQLGKTNGATLTTTSATTASAKLAGLPTIVRFRGTEGTLISWSVVSRGRTVIMTMIEGKDTPSIRSTMDRLTNSLPTS